MNAYHALETYTLQAPAWREPLTIATSAYPELYPGATALYPPASGSSASTSTYAGQSRDAANVDTGIVGVTKAKEDDLSETAVKSGLVTRPYVQSETFSAHQLIYPKFTHGHALPILSKLVSLVLEKRQSSPDITPQPGQWVYKPPSRVVYNDARREAWFNDLANPAVSLHKLSKNIPNNPASVATAGTGTYGAGRTSASSSSGSAIDKHLEMLVSRQIQIDRAVWFLRAIAGAEVAQALKSSRSVTSLPPAATYLMDFTASIFEAVRRQLNEIVLPLTHHAGLGLSSRPGMSVKGRARNTLAEEQGRVRFLTRWKYLLALIDSLAREALIERSIWASKVLECLATCHLAQIGWMVDLVTDTCFFDITNVGWMCKSLVAILVARLADLEMATPHEPKDMKTLLSEATASIRSLLRRIWLKNKNAFVLPQLHAQHDTLRVLQQAALSDAEDSIHWHSVISRVEDLRCEGGPSDKQVNSARYADMDNDSPEYAAGTSQSLSWHKPLARSPGASYFLAILDAHTTQDSLAELCSDYLVPPSPPCLDRRASHASAGTPSSTAKPIPAMSVSSRLDLLLDWTVSMSRFGDHRKYLCLHICKVYLDTPIALEHLAASAEPPHQAREDRQATIQKSIVKLLDSIDRSDQCDRETAVDLCCELIAHDVLDIASISQMVVTRGISPVPSASFKGEIYLRILKASPTHVTSQSLRYQLARSTSSIHPVEEPAFEKALAREKARISSQSPLLIGALLGDSTRGTEADCGACEKAVLTCPEKRDLYKTWLVPEVVSHFGGGLDRDAEYAEQLAAVIKTLQAVKDYDGVLQISYAVLAHSSNRVVLDLVMDVLLARTCIWHPKGVIRDILEAAWRAHQRLVVEGNISISLAGFLTELGQAGAIDDSRFEYLAVDLAALRHAEIDGILDPFSPLSGSDATDGIFHNVGSLEHVNPGEQAKQDIRLQARALDSPLKTVTDILGQLVNGDDTQLAHVIEVFSVIHQNLPSGLNSELIGALCPSGSRPLITMLLQDGGSLTIPRFLQAIVLRGAVELFMLLHDAIEPAFQVCLGLLKSDYSHGVQLAHNLLDLVEPFWSWDNIEDADSLRLEARFIVSLAGESIDTVLSCLSAVLAIASLLHSDQSDLRKRCEAVCDELVSHAEFKVAILRELDRIATLLLSSSPHAWGLQTLSYIVTSLKPRTTSGDYSAQQSEEVQSASASVYASQLAQIELRLYLKELESRPKDSFSTQGAAFARQFVEKMLQENTAGTSVIVGQLSAFGPSGIQQLLQACLDIAMRILDALATASESSVLLFSRLQRLLTIARHLLQQTEYSDAVPELVVDPSFAHAWTSATQSTVSAANESSLVQLKILCDACCLAMRYTDIWSDHQTSLRESLDVLLKLAKNENSCETPNLLNTLDVISYFLDHASAPTRHQALLAFQQMDVTISHTGCQFLAAFQWLTALGPSPSTILESSPSAEDRLALYKPWEYAEHTEPPVTTPREAATANSGSIDLHRLSARVLSVISSHDGSEDKDADRGQQSNFDSEIPILQESIWRSDYRRSLNVQLEVPPPTTGAPTPAPPEAASPNAYAPVPAAVKSELAKPAKSAASVKAGAEPAAATTKKQTTKKRKIAPEVIVVEDESPKRKKTASKKKK